MVSRPSPKKWREMAAFFNFITKWILIHHTCADWSSFGSFGIWDEPWRTQRCCLWGPWWPWPWGSATATGKMVMLAKLFTMILMERPLTWEWRLAMDLIILALRYVAARNSIISAEQCKHLAWRRWQWPPWWWWWRWGPGGSYRMWALTRSFSSTSRSQTTWLKPPSNVVFNCIYDFHFPYKKSSSLLPLQSL